MTGITRRQLIGGLVVAAAGAGVAGGAVRYLPSVLDFRSDVQRLFGEIVGLIPVPDPIGLGKAYQAQHPDGAEPAVLLEAVFGDLQPTDNVAEKMSEKFRQDFIAGRTVVLKGWTLSRTEGRFLALLPFAP